MSARVRSRCDPWRTCARGRVMFATCAAFKYGPRSGRRRGAPIGGCYARDAVGVSYGLKWQVSARGRARSYVGNPRGDCFAAAKAAIDCGRCKALLSTEAVCKHHRASPEELR